MPKPPNTAARIAIPLVVLALGIVLAWSIFRTPANKAAQAPQPAPTSTGPGTPAQPTSTAQNPAAQPTPPGAGQSAPTPTTTPTPAPAAAPLGTLVAQDFGTPPTFAPLGSSDPAQDRAQVSISHTGLGVASFMLSDSFDTIRKANRVVVQAEHRVQGSQSEAVLAPLAALAIEVTPTGAPAQTVALFDSRLWREAPGTPGVYEAILLDGSTPVLRVRRRFELRQASASLSVHQTVENLSGSPLSVRWFQVGPVDMHLDDAGYGGEKRRVRFGYLLSPEMDPTRSVVVSDSLILPRAKVLGSRTPVKLPDGRDATDASGAVLSSYGEVTQWPNKESTESKYALTWVGVTNRYFGAAVHPLVDPAAKSPDKTLAWVGQVTRIVLDPGQAGQEVMALRLDSHPLPLAPIGQPGASADLSLGLYAGPLDKATILQDPILTSAGVKGLVYYNFGGMCGFCTFSWLTGALYAVMHALHDYVFQDWALGIIFLVVVVRSCLHPITRFSQIRTARFGKQMQAVAPKQKLIQEKYKDDPLRLQQETRKLWAEEGISPAGFLGCLPMFLQTPVWIALYATLYFAFELRHQPAFYGVFQSIQGQGSPFWWFLGDLAEPDRLWYFAGSPEHYISIPVLSGLMGKVGSVNILPLVLGIVFFIQQKYLTPQTQASTPEQEMQMKMMKWMTVFMFPIFMYNAPAGLSIYFIANSTLGIIESKWIRRHMESKGLLDLDKMRAERQAKRAAKGTSTQPGWLAKLSAIAEDQARKGQKGPGRR